MSLSSITTSATQPVGRHFTKPARPTSVESILRPRPEGSSTPSGAMTRSRRLLPSAVRSTMTTRLMFGLSSAATLCTSAHCSLLAPGGVSQRNSQSPYLALTNPCAAAVWAAPAAPRSRVAPKIPRRSRIGLMQSPPVPNATRRRERRSRVPSKWRYPVKLHCRRPALRSRLYAASRSSLGRVALPRPLWSSTPSIEPGLAVDRRHRSARLRVVCAWFISRDRESGATGI